jgi:Fe-S-cluster containining protein
MRKLPNNENKDCCSKCKNCCCSFYPGAWAPGQLTLQQIEELIHQKKASFWVYYSESNYAWLRPRNVPEEEYTIVTFGKPGKCVFLKEDGCSLPFEDRPYECQSVVPDKDNSCISIITFKQIVGYWKNSNKYQKILDKLKIDARGECHKCF